MELQVFYQNPEQNITLFLPEEDDFILLQLSESIDHESYKSAFEKLYQMARVYSYKKVIYDLKDLTHTDQQSRSWYATLFLPKVIKNLGFNFKTAIIRPQNDFENSSVIFLTNLSRNLGFKDTIHFFETREAAIAWMMNKEITVIM